MPGSTTKPDCRGRVVVAMSGGVDSSVAAALLVEQGHEVVGVHMRLHDAEPGRPGRCCGLDDALDARRVAERLGIPFHVLDLRDAFDRAVVAPFRDAWLAGRTPNPCVLCNGVLKWRVLLGRAMAMGARWLATGHYARIGPGPVLRAARDPDKDQSYFLFPMGRRALERTRFPLGDCTKREVRAHAARLGLPTAAKPESQEICFVPEGDHGAWMEARVGARPGPIRGPDGRVVGRHRGTFRYTVGQRRGLGVALGRPVYVAGVDPATNTVQLGEADALWHGGLVAGGWTWHREPGADEPVEARIRHRGRRLPARVEPLGDGRWRVRFLEPAWAVAPGQAVVVYRGADVLGGGWIERALPRAEAPRPRAAG